MAVGTPVFQESYELMANAPIVLLNNGPRLDAWLLLPQQQPTTESLPLAQGQPQSIRQLLTIMIALRLEKDTTALASPSPIAAHALLAAPGVPLHRHATADALPTVVGRAHSCTARPHLA